MPPSRLFVYVGLFECVPVGRLCSDGSCLHVHVGL